MNWQNILKISKGKEWLIYHIRKNLDRESRLQIDELADNQEAAEFGEDNFNHHYEHIATIQFDGDEIGPNSLFRLTNNVDEEWAKEFAGEQDGWNMIIEVDKPHRSSMVGDVFFDKDNNMYWMVAGHGFKAVDVRGD
tara:strand:+ start:710 stop:1120 length:411 start_codon:yes stop_codon:yes gene_type:complete